MTSRANMCRWSTSLIAQKKFVVNFWENFAIKKKDVCNSVSIASINPTVSTIGLKGAITSGAVIESRKSIYVI